MKRFLFLLIVFILAMGNQTYAKSPVPGYVAPWDTLPMPMTLRFTAVYVDTMTIESPILVNINGFGFLTPKKVFTPHDPTSCLKSFQTSAMVALFYELCESNKKLVGTDDIVILVNPKVTNELYERNHKTIKPKFEYSHTVKGCDIYVCTVDKLLIEVYLMQCSTFNAWSNPMIEWAVPVKEIKPRHLESLYPDLEYIRIAQPIKITQDDDEEDE